MRADIRHATLGGVSVGAMAGRGIADSDKFMVPHVARASEIALQAPSVGAGVLENNTFDLTPGILNRKYNFDHWEFVHNKIWFKNIFI